jgi:hypothetical protein
MEGRRFDAIARTLAAGLARRGALCLAAEAEAQPQRSGIETRS